MFNYLEVQFYISLRKKITNNNNKFLQKKIMLLLWIKKNKIKINPKNNKLELNSTAFYNFFQTFKRISV